MFARLLRLVLLTLSLLIPLQASLAMPIIGQDDCCASEISQTDCHQGMQDSLAGNSSMMCCQLHAATPAVIQTTPPLLAPRETWQELMALAPESCIPAPPEHPPRQV